MCVCTYMHKSMSITYMYTYMHMYKILRAASVGFGVIVWRPLGMEIIQELVFFGDARPVKASKSGVRPHKPRTGSTPILLLLPSRIPDLCKYSAFEHVYPAAA